MNEEYVSFFEYQAFITQLINAKKYKFIKNKSACCWSILRMVYSIIKIVYINGVN